MVFIDNAPRATALSILETAFNVGCCTHNLSKTNPSLPPYDPKKMKDLLVESGLRGDISYEDVTAIINMQGLREV